MVTRERLYQLIDALPEQDVATVARILEALTGLEADEPFYTTETAPLDDEPETEQERRAVAEALEASARGEVLTTASVRRRLGL
jgi:hypothetical protein